MYNVSYKIISNKNIHGSKDIFETKSIYDLINILEV